MEVIFNGKVTSQGNLILYDRNTFQNEMHLFAGKEIKVAVSEKKRMRSNKQNRAYYGYVLPMVRHGLIGIGYKVSFADTKEILRVMFLKKEIINEETGEIIEGFYSTAELSTLQFMEYIESIQQWASEFLNIVIPDPRSQSQIEFKP